MQILFWMVVLIGSGYSFWYAYYLKKDKNKFGAFGITIIGLLIFGLSFFVKIK